jgi:hypothetical protein
LVQRDLGEQLLQQRVLGLQLTQPLGVAGIHPIELRPLLVERGAAKAPLAAHLGAAHASVSLPMNPMICSSVYLFLRILLLLGCAEFVRLRWYGSRGACQNSLVLALRLISTIGVFWTIVVSILTNPQ